MKPPVKVILTFYVSGLVGAALFIALLIRQGASQVGAAVAAAKWALAVIVVYHLIVTTWFDALAWWLLFPNQDRLPLRKMAWMRWIGESVSTLVPSAAIGGEIVRARLAALQGASLSLAAASVLIDLTLNLFCLAGYTLLGLALLVFATGQSHLIAPILIGTALAFGIFAGFYFAQHAGIFGFLARIIARLANAPEWKSLVQGGESLDRMVRTLYARRLAIGAALAAALVALIGGAGEIWIGLRILRLDATLVHALILQSLTLALRSAAFPVPAAIGVQEGGYVFVGSLLGIPGEAAFALSLFARVRELTIGVPGLFAWQLIETRRLWHGRAPGAAR